MKLYIRDPDISILGDVMMHIPLIETKANIMSSPLLKIGNKIYRCHSVDVVNDSMLLTPIEIIEDVLSDETIIDTSWTCPICRYIDDESYELPDKSSDYECPRCGAITEYEVEHVASYAVTLKRKPVIQIVEGKDQ